MRKDSVYTLHPGFAMEVSSLAKLKEKTGRDLEQWVRIVKKSGLTKESEQAEWLKKEHGFTTNYAGWVAERAGGSGGSADYDPDALVEALFSGKRSSLRPIYDQLLQMAFALGKDVRVCPCKTIVPFYRKHVFAQVKPTTISRIDLGFAFKDMKPSGKLVSTGGFQKGDRISHSIPIESIADIDAEVKKWLKRAYEMDV
jgi:hypothetical protein